MSNQTLAEAFTEAMAPGGRLRQQVRDVGVLISNGVSAIGEITDLAAGLAAFAAAHERPKVQVGDVLHGYCMGIFGDFYGDKVVEAIGAGWVVVRTEGLAILGDATPEDLVEFLTEENRG